MAIVSILHLADIYKIKGPALMSLMAELQTKKLHKPDALLITGVTEEGHTSEDFVNSQIAMSQLFHFLKLKPNQIIIEPNAADLAKGYGPFVDLFYEPLKKTAYDQSRVGKDG